MINNGLMWLINDTTIGYWLRTLGCHPVVDYNHPTGVDRISNRNIPKVEKLLNMAGDIQHLLHYSCAHIGKLVGFNLSQKY